MRKFLTDKEITAALKSLCVIVDTREKSTRITEHFSAKDIPFAVKTMKTGDYTFEYDGMRFDDEVVIERKNSIDEIAANFTIDRQRFENEFLRVKAAGAKAFLIIENCSWEKIKNGDYRSQIKPQALMASLLCWQVRYGITINFCKPEDTAELIYGILYYWLKERLQN